MGNYHCSAANSKCSRNETGGHTATFQYCSSLPSVPCRSYSPGHDARIPCAVSAYVPTMKSAANSGFSPHPSSRSDIVPEWYLSCGTVDSVGTFRSHADLSRRSKGSKAEDHLWRLRDHLGKGDTSGRSPASGGKLHAVVRCSADSSTSHTNRIVRIPDKHSGFRKSYSTRTRHNLYLLNYEINWMIYLSYKLALFYTYLDVFCSFIYVTGTATHNFRKFSSNQALPVTSTLSLKGKCRQIRFSYPFYLCGPDLTESIFGTIHQWIYLWNKHIEGR